MPAMKIAFVLGTRPEILKIAPLIRECRRSGTPYVLIHTNQHYTASMDDVFFQELELPAPDFNLGVGSGSHAAQTAAMMIKIEQALLESKPTWMVVQGDTNSTLAGALVAAKAGVRVAHVEAGLRSGDREMPEETNRIIVDHISDMCFAVSPIQEKLLLSEGIESRKVAVSGNTIVDTLLQSLKLSEKSDVLRRQGLDGKKYAVLTLHRPSNVDDPAKLKRLISDLGTLADERGLTVVWPVHPRVNLVKAGLEGRLPARLKTIEPLGYLDFLRLMRDADVLLTDSGGIQEEACILRIPCLTLRENTERPETLDVGSNALVGADLGKMRAALKDFDSRKRDWSNPFGDGKSAERIIASLKDWTPA